MLEIYIKKYHIYKLLCLPSIGDNNRHLVNGSPLCPWIHVQAGKWLNTVQIAFWPQLPGQGSRHFILIHAKLGGQSWFIAHSGRQLGGVPWKFVKQEHEGKPLLSLQTAFSPHGLGTHGSFGTSDIIWIAVVIKKNKIFSY